MSDTAKQKILVSGCLAGLPCSHDGRDRLHPPTAALKSAGAAIIVCPEQLGGRPTPRETCEIAGGDGSDVLDGRARVLTLSGEDVTDAFIRGAQTALKLAQKHGCRLAVLKARSPSCGRGTIYDGSFSGARRPGDGVTAALLARNGIKVKTEEEF